MPKSPYNLEFEQEDRRYIFTTDNPQDFSLFIAMLSTIRRNGEAILSTKVHACLGQGLDKLNREAVEALLRKYTKTEASDEDNLCKNGHTEVQISEESLQCLESKPTNPKIQLNFIKGNKENTHKSFQPNIKLTPKTQSSIKQTTKSYSILPEDISQEKKSMEKNEGMMDLAR